MCESLLEQERTEEDIIKHIKIITYHDSRITTMRSCIELSILIASIYDIKKEEFIKLIDERWDLFSSSNG